MSKMNLFLASLVAAVPGAFLVYQMVMVFLSSADKLTTGTMGLAGFALALGATPALMPIAILVLMGKDPNAPPKKKKGAPEDEADAEVLAAESGEVEEVAAEVEDADALSDADLMADDFESDHDLTVTNAELEIEEPLDEFSDEFAVEPEEEEEAPPPKKKKK